MITSDEGGGRAVCSRCVFTLVHLANGNCKNKSKTSIHPHWYNFIDLPTYQGWQIHHVEVIMWPKPIKYCSVPPQGGPGVDGWPWFLSIIKKGKDGDLQSVGIGINFPNWETPPVELLAELFRSGCAPRRCCGVLGRCWQRYGTWQLLTFPFRFTEIKICEESWTVPTCTQVFMEQNFKFSRLWSTALQQWFGTSSRGVFAGR